MRLIELNIKNYKSLGDVHFRPTPLSVLVGPNGSGKSNFASALSFLAEVYEFGLETAVRRKGGFENIVMRTGERRSLEFSILIEIEKHEDLDDLFDQEEVGIGVAKLLNIKTHFINHTFTLKEAGKKKFEYAIKQESLSIVAAMQGGNSKELLNVNREFNEVKVKHDKVFSFVSKVWLLDEAIDTGEINFPQNLLVHSSSGFFGFLNKTINKWVAYQLNPLSVRQPGSPTPNPEISAYGDNLPSLVDWLKTNHSSEWSSVLHIMQSVLPTLADITTDYLHNRRLGLFFFEEASSQPWNSEEVSDGTIITLSLLCAIFDPRKQLMLIEEIENSLHPWALRTLLEEIRKQTDQKNIILTTHSPLVLDMLYPKEIWCLSKPGNETHLDKLIDLAPEIEQDWERGNIRISDYLDAGLVPNAVPGGLS